MANRWVIPDIHGCAKTLKSLLDFHVKPTKHDMLYFLGDYIDRGPDSKGVIDIIRKLQDDEYNVRLLKGNHEDYLIKAYAAESERKSFLGIKSKNRMKEEWKKYGGKETLESFGVKDLKDIPIEYIDWLAKLELFIELDDFVLVHAGLNFNNDDPFEDEHAILWLRDFKPQPEKINMRTLIHGHVPINLELIHHLKGGNSYKYIDLDNGIYMSDRSGFGNLVALELNSMEVVAQNNVDMG
ncbi:metallophosphoesterase family protein [Bacteroidota bacterium]